MMYSTFTRDKKCSLLLQKADITTTATAPKQTRIAAAFIVSGDRLISRIQYKVPSLVIIFLMLITSQFVIRVPTSVSRDKQHAS